MLIMVTSKFPSFTIKAEAKAVDLEPFESIVKTYSRYVNGIEQNLIITKTKFDSLRVYFQIGEEEPELLFIDILDTAFDER